MGGWEVCGDGGGVMIMRETSHFMVNSQYIMTKTETSGCSYMLVKIMKINTERNN